MARVRIRLEMRGWSVMVVLLGIEGRTNRIDELGALARKYRIWWCQDVVGTGCPPYDFGYV